MQLKPSQGLYSNVYLALVQLLPNECDGQLTTMALLMVGVFGARSVQTGRLAANVPLQMKKPSIVRRMERFFDSGAVRSWYEPIARWLVSAASVNGQVALVVDSSKVSRPGYKSHLSVIPAHQAAH